MIKALIITAPGINCDLELAEGFALAGATPWSVHINELLDNPTLIDEADLVGLPGGFSYGDSIAAGRIMANLMRKTLYPKFADALRRGVPMIAPCNGFQIAVQLGLLPGPIPGSDWSDVVPQPTVALVQNDTARFIDKWVEFKVPSNTRCIWTKNITSTPETSYIPTAQPHCVIGIHFRIILYIGGIELSTFAGIKPMTMLGQNNDIPNSTTR